MHKAISILYLFESIVWLVTLPEVSVKRIDAFLKWMKLQTTRRWVRWLRRKFRWFAAVGKPTLLLWGRLLLLGTCWARAWRICAQASRRKLSEAFLVAVRQAGMMATSTTLWHCATSNCCTPRQARMLTGSRTCFAQCPSRLQVEERNTKETCTWQRRAFGSWSLKRPNYLMSMLWMEYGLCCLVSSLHLIFTRKRSSANNLRNACDLWWLDKVPLRF